MDRLKYAEQGQEKPARGFDTSDFSRRDEFTMTFRTEQYRTLLKAGLLLCYHLQSVLCWRQRNPAQHAHQLCSACLNKRCMQHVIAYN